MAFSRTGSTDCMIPTPNYSNGSRATRGEVYWETGERTEHTDPRNACRRARVRARKPPNLPQINNRPMQGYVTGT